MSTQSTSFLSKSIPPSHDPDVQIWGSINSNHGNENNLQEENNLKTLACSSSINQSLPLEFIQVLIHQHAKTLVALKSLHSEVRTLRDPNNISSNHDTTPSNHDDSGFQNSSSDLYSLLSQIESKIKEKKHASPSSKKSPNLGHLDNVFNHGNSFHGNIEKNVVRAILNCDDVVELRRQLLFCVGEVVGLKGEVEGLKRGRKESIIGSRSLGSHGNGGRSLIPVRIKKRK